MTNRFERFWKLIEVRGPDECWPWLGTTHRDGRGSFRADGNPKPQSAPRLLARYLGWKVDDPAIYVCHTCDNPNCMNVKHFFLGTIKDNMRDLSEKGLSFNQRKTHCIRGHEFTPENTYKNANGKNRKCKKCADTGSNRRAKAKRAAARAQAQEAR